jgi:hypothetical protein
MSVTATNTAARRKAYFEAWADEALAAEDAVEAERERHQKAEAEAAAGRAELEVQRAKLEAARLTYIAEADAAADLLVKAIRQVLDLAVEERNVTSRLGRPPVHVTEDGIKRRLSTYLSNSLRAMEGPTAPSFGGLKLAHVSPLPGGSWVAAEKFWTGIRSNDDDDPEDAQ